MSYYQSEWNKQIEETMKALGAGANALFMLIFVAGLAYVAYWIVKDRKRD